MKKILILNYEFPPLGGGAANATFNILEEYSKRKDLQIDLITSSVDRYKVEQFAENITIYYLDIGKNKNLHFQSSRDLLVYSLKAYLKARELIKTQSYDLIHAFFGIPCGFIASKLGLPYIVSLRGSDVPFYSKRFYWADKLFFQYLSRRIWKKAKAVIAVSDDLVTLAKTTAPDQAISIIMNGVNSKEFFPDKLKLHAEKRFNILFVGRFIERKGFSYLYEAFKRLAVRFPEIRLHAAGDGPLRDKFVRLAAQDGLSDRIHFYGNLPKSQLPGLYQKCHVFVLPSINEALGNVVHEAMASSMPILCTRTGSSELLLESGLEIEKRSAGSIEEKLEFLILNPEICTKMSEKSREMALKMSWEACANSYIELYKNQRVLVLNYEFPPLGGGASVISYEITQRLSEHFQVDVVTMGYKDLPAFEEFSPTFRVHRVKCMRSKKEICHPWEQYSYLRAAYRKCKELMKDNKYDICHTHFLIPTGILARRLKNEYNLPYIVTCHGSDIPDFNSDRFRFLHKFTGPVLRGVAREAKKIIAPSSYLLGLILGNISRDLDAKIEVIPNGFDPDKFRPAPKKKIILSTGRLFPRKGFQQLLEACADEDVGYELHICGNGPMMEKLKKLKEISKTKVVLHGWMDNRSDEYKDLLETASIYVLASKKENASVSLLEAMSAGCAVITSDVSGCPETVGEAGILVKPADTADLKLKLTELIAHPDQIELLQKKSRQRLETRFSWNTIIATYLKNF